MATPISIGGIVPEIYQTGQLPDPTIEGAKQVVRPFCFVITNNTNGTNEDSDVESSMLEFFDPVDPVSPLPICRRDERDIRPTKCEGWLHSIAIPFQEACSEPMRR